MKTIFSTLFLGLTISFWTFEAFSSPCDRMCSPECLKYASEILTGCSNSKGPDSRPSRRDGSVEFFHSDTCSSSLIATIDEIEDCSRISTNENVWGVRVNGICHNISDTSFSTACRSFAGGSVEFYRSDSCSSNLLATASGQNACSEIPVSDNVWAVKINGTCHNISDTSFKEACMAFAGGGKRNTRLYHSDNCDDGRLVGVIGPRTNCESLRGDTVWGIEKNGQCQNISDTDIVSACQQYKN